MKHSHPLRLLCLEDNIHDRELIEHHLKVQGMPCQIAYAQTREEFIARLQQVKFDMIMSDFTLPGYDGLSALAAARELQPETPFIFVSGTIGEERAVESLRSGATDYVVKNHLGRLGPAVQRALREAKERQRRRAAEESLKESEARFRQVAENIDEVFWLVDIRQNKILYISQAYEKIWKRTRESLYEDPQSWFAAIHPLDRDRVFQASVAHQARGSYDETYRIVRPDGSMRWIRDVAYPIRDEAGEVYRIVGIAEDVTERRHLEEQLRQAQKMEAIGQLASGVAHDFNNLLAVIRGNAEIVLMGGDRSADQNRECLKHIVAASERAANLTRQLLAFGRKQMIHPQPVNLNRTLESLTRMLKPILGERIELRYEYCPAGAFALVDPALLEQVIVNLVVNARDAMPNGGQLTITTEKTRLEEIKTSLPAEKRTGDFICLSVSDTGTGIAPQHLSHLFEPFFTTKSPGKGSGLGLAMSYGIVKQHQGWIEVQSHVGAGTTFKIFLPASAPAPLKAAPVPAKAAPRGTERILLVEDEPAVRSLTRQLLESHGYQVFEAQTGKEALNRWGQDLAGIDLLLTDMTMPGGVSGRDLAVKLQQLRPDLRVIFMSGYSAEMAAADMPDDLPSGPRRFLQKPCPAPLLLQTVRQYLDEKVQI